MADAILRNDRADFEKFGKAFLDFSDQPLSTAYRPVAEAMYRGLKQEYFG